MIFLMTPPPAAARVAASGQGLSGYGDGGRWAAAIKIVAVVACQGRGGRDLQRSGEGGRGASAGSAPLQLRATDESGEAACLRRGQETPGRCLPTPGIRRQSAGPAAAWSKTCSFGGRQCSDHLPHICTRKFLVLDD